MVSLSNHAPYGKNVLRQAQDERIESIHSTLQSSYPVRRQVWLECPVRKYNRRALSPDEWLVVGVDWALVTYHQYHQPEYYSVNYAEFALCST